MNYIGNTLHASTFDDLMIYQDSSKRGAIVIKANCSSSIRIRRKYSKLLLELCGTACANTLKTIAKAYVCRDGRVDVSRPGNNEAKGKKYSTEIMYIGSYRRQLVNETDIIFKLLLRSLHSFIPHISLPIRAGIRKSFQTTHYYVSSGHSQKCM